MITEKQTDAFGNQWWSFHLFDSWGFRCAHIRRHHMIFYYRIRYNYTHIFVRYTNVSSNYIFIINGMERNGFWISLICIVCLLYRYDPNWVAYTYHMFTILYKPYYTIMSVYRFYIKKNCGNNKRLILSDTECTVNCTVLYFHGYHCFVTAVCILYYEYWK